ncbi:homoserine kinase [Ekhidna sp.]
MEEVTVFAPASVANIGCGYDTMGFSLDSIGEEITVSKRNDEKVVIKEIIGANLSTDPLQNVATIAIQALLDALNSTQGFDVSIHKSIKPGSGLGSSASSAAGAVFAVNELMDRPFSKSDLLQYAMEGEAFASKCYHADNVAPSLLGGLQVIRSYEPLDLFRINDDLDLSVLLIFPDVEVKTSESKKLLPKEVSIELARNQWANVAGLVHAFNTADLELLRKSISDYIAEPIRKNAIPKYDQVKEIVNENGAVGFNISGSGPSMFAFFKNKSMLTKAENKILAIYEECDFDLKIYKTKIDHTGCKVIS